MRRFVIFLLVILWVSWPLTVFGEKKFNKVRNRRGTRPYFTVDENGVPWLGYYGVDDVLYVTNGKKGSQQGKISVEGVIGSSVSLDFADDEVLAFWRGKVSASGRKYLYVNRARRDTLDFGNATAINTASDVLLPVEVLRTGNHVTVTWADERTKPNTFYMNRSIDGGRTFRPENMCLAPGFATSRSSLIADRDGYSFFFFGRNEANKETGIFCRSSSDGWNWGGITKVASVKDWAPFDVRALVAGNGPVVVWGGVRGLFYAYRDARGWHDGIVAPTEDMDVNRFQIARDSKGNLFLLASYKKWQQHIQRPNVFLFRSADGGITWQEPVKINHNAFDNTSAKFPAMFVTEKDALVVVWEDHRLIRGNIYMNYSLDGGKTWLPEDINLDDEPGRYNDFYPFISGHDDKVQVLWPRYPDDKLYGPVDFYFKEVGIQ